MNIKNIKVYHLFWFVAVIILLIGIINLKETLDINIHDTYFVIPYLHFIIVLFLFYFLSGLGYWLLQKVLKRQLQRPLTVIHSVIIIGSFSVYWLVVFYCKLFLNGNFPVFDDGSRLINMTIFYEFVFVYFIGLPIYITNLLIGIFRKSHK